MHGTMGSSSSLQGTGGREDAYQSAGSVHGFSPGGVHASPWLRHCVMCDVQLGPDGVMLRQDSGVMQALQSLGGSPCYVVLDFETSLP